MAIALESDSNLQLWGTKMNGKYVEDKLLVFSFARCFCYRLTSLGRSLQWGWYDSCIAGCLVTIAPYPGQYIAPPQHIKSLSARQSHPILIHQDEENFNTARRKNLQK